MSNRPEIPFGAVESLLGLPVNRKMGLSGTKRMVNRRDFFQEDHWVAIKGEYPPEWDSERLRCPFCLSRYPQAIIEPDFLEDERWYLRLRCSKCLRELHQGILLPYPNEGIRPRPVWPVLPDRGQRKITEFF